MCISTEALALFLNMILHTPMTSEPGRITIHAEARNAYWVAVGDRWCTMAPQIDRMARLEEVAQ
ncbi:hypothetical protein [Pseudoprimorskyibacter insulae]|uniref:Uncharacterized protein n=1 Tax=Pseudoprimorskyibacter insulae TaxID=1695997 RepID=A0A2R8APJ9_9RHOB|nr:hypothetical protein [Pseudoprimorskyibacter insulae]SPF77900.1 hypothetical protein PRI8871_00487 [Pseudoprimorskyibacter insulae]